MKFLTSLLLLFFCVTAGCGQNVLKQQRLDSLRFKLEADSLHTYRFKIFRPYGNIDNRSSFYRPSNFTGYQLGAIINEYHTFGIGFYKLNRAANARSTINQGYKLSGLRYNTVFYEYLLFNKRYYEVDLPFELGFGTFRAKHTDTLNVNYNKSILPSFLPLSAGIKFIVKPVRWVGVSIMAGYQYFVEVGKNRVLDFNNFYYPVGVWIDFRQIYRDIKYFGFQKKRYRKEVEAISMTKSI